MSAEDLHFLWVLAVLSLMLMYIQKWTLSQKILKQNQPSKNLFTKTNPNLGKGFVKC